MLIGTFTFLARESQPKAAFRILREDKKARTFGEKLVGETRIVIKLLRT